jgi:DNA-binding NtrC family response regulator
MNKNNVERQLNTGTVAARPDQTRLEADASAALTSSETAPVGTLRSLRAATEMNAISRALEQTGWNRRRAAEMLKISYRGLLYKIRQHNIIARTGAEVTPLK